MSAADCKLDCVPAKRAASIRQDAILVDGALFFWLFGRSNSTRPERLVRAAFFSGDSE
jgi:hypothetical protein